MSYAEADAAAREIAAGLVAGRRGPGDRVCLVAQTRLEWALCDVGILLAGGVTVPIYASNTAEQCEFIIRDAGAKIVIVEDVAQRDKVLPLRDRLFTVTGIVQIAEELPAGDAVRSLAALRDDGRRWLEAQRVRGPSTPTPRRSAPSRCSPSSTPRAPPGPPRGWCSRTRTSPRQSAAPCAPCRSTKATSSICFFRWRTSWPARPSGWASRPVTSRRSRAGRRRSKRTSSPCARRSWPASRASTRSSTLA